MSHSTAHRRKVRTRHGVARPRGWPVHRPPVYRLTMREQPSDRLLHVALAVFAIGLVATITMFAVPALDDGVRAPVWVYALTLGLPIGFVLAIVFALRSGRRRPGLHDDDSRGTR
ncbi:hypothetical protein LX12_002108 [Williamsia serinedens]|uniref:DUF2530 domain-containing protein n=2 Tax=Williamsia serinedens TaxID=391736 RepID=A0ABT1H1A9_9NOCA|nr:hypothetical protein [Williamsia serinedens]